MPAEITERDLLARLAIEGFNFLSGFTEVWWEPVGGPAVVKPAIVLSSGRLEVALTAAEVAHAATVRVTVRNRGQDPSATASNSADFVIIERPGKPEFVRWSPRMGTQDTVAIQATGHPSEYRWTVESAAVTAGERAEGFRSLSTARDALELRDATPLPPGRYRLTAVALNRLGAVSPSSAIEFEVSDEETPSVKVFPNPWDVRRHAGHPVTFEGLPDGARVKLFSLAGHWIQTVAADAGSARWDMRNASGNPVASGVYLYIIEGPRHSPIRGKLIVIQ
jgi:hypothetical protein